MADFVGVSGPNKDTLLTALAGILNAADIADEICNIDFRVESLNLATQSGGLREGQLVFESDVQDTGRRIYTLVVEVFNQPPIDKEDGPGDMPAVVMEDEQDALARITDLMKQAEGLWNNGELEAGSVLLKSAIRQMQERFGHSKPAGAPRVVLDQRGHFQEFQPPFQPPGRQLEEEEDYDQP